MLPFFISLQLFLSLLATPKAVKKKQKKERHKASFLLRSGGPQRDPPLDWRAGTVEERCDGKKKKKGRVEVVKKPREKTKQKASRVSNREGDGTQKRNNRFLRGGRLRAGGVGCQNCAFGCLASGDGGGGGGGGGGNRTGKKKFFF